MSKSHHWKENKQKITFLFWTNINGTFLIASPFFSNFLLLEGFLRFFVSPDLRITDAPMLYSSQSLLSQYTQCASAFLCGFEEVWGGCTSTIILLFFQTFLTLPLLLSFYLSLSCWTVRQQYKAKHNSHWKYLHHPSPECVLFLLQLYTAQGHIHETTHNFGYFEGTGKTSNKSKTSKKIQE